jgi:membrane dipeptidase
MMGVTYGESNNLGSGLNEENDGGLTNFGRQVIKRYNDIGMAIDVSHSGDKTALDVIEASTQPIFITHVGAKALWNIKRFKPDDALRACAEKGGVIGIEAAPHTTMTKNHPKQNIESVMEHFEYVANLVGIDHVGFGPDTMYGDHVAMHHAYSQTFSLDANTEEVPYVEGLENPTEASWNIVRWLVKHAYSDEEIKKVTGGNALTVLKEVWPQL